MGFVINAGQAGEAGPPGPPASSETTAWVSLVLTDPTASGTVEWRTQATGQTLQLRGSLTFSTALDQLTVIAVVPVTVSQVLEAPITATTTGPLSVVAGLEIDTSGNLSIVPFSNQPVDAVWFAQSLPLT
jgi:hypothetical protein